MVLADILSARARASVGGRRFATAPACSDRVLRARLVWVATISGASLFLFVFEQCARQGILRIAFAKCREPGASFFVPAESAQFGEAGQPLIWRQLRQRSYCISVLRCGLPRERARFSACVSGLWRRWCRGRRRGYAVGAIRCRW